MHTIAELQSIIAVTEAELKRAFDEKKSFYEKKEIRQRIRLYTIELNELYNSRYPDKDLNKTI